MASGSLTLAETGLELSGWGLLPVSRGAGVLGVLLGHLPLASAADLAAVQGVRVEGVYAKLWELHKGGYVGRCMLGWSRSRVARWWLTERGLEGMGVFGATWHEEWGRCNLLERLPVVEWFYRASAMVRGYGRLRAFQWLDGLSFDAAVRYEGGWVAMYWSGLWQTEAMVRRRLAGLGKDLLRQGMLDDSVWPGLLCFVVNDRWQRELVYRAARKSGLVEHVAVMCVSDESRDGAWDGGPSRGYVYQPFDGKDTGGWSFEKRVESGPWGSVGGQVVCRLLDCVAEWPGMEVKMGKAALAEGSGTKRSGKALKELVNSGLVLVDGSASAPRYSVSGRGVDVLRRRDRMGYVYANDRSQAWSWLRRPRLKDHEDGVMDVMGRFMSAGLPVAAGWRSWESLGGGGGIAPDGMVYLYHGLFGEGWHYVEYERSARGESRVRRKLNGYGAKNRQDRWPLLVVARDESAEAVFSDVGVENGLLMVTTNIERMKKVDMLGNLECWRLYGRGVAIG